MHMHISFCDSHMLLLVSYLLFVKTYIIGLSLKFEYIFFNFLSFVQKYHPSRVLTLVYQPFAFITLAILAYNEEKINTRLRNLFGYTVFFFGILALLIVNLIHLFVDFDASRI